MSWFLNKWVLTAIFAALALAGVGFKSYYAGKKTVYAEWNADKLKQAEALAKATQQVRSLERSMQATTDKLSKEKRDALNSATRQHRAVVERLRDDNATLVARLSRPTGDGKGGRRDVEAVIPREIAESLFDEALRADVLRLSLEQCYAQYDAVRTPGKH